MNIAFRAARAIYRGSGLKAKVVSYAERQKAFSPSQQQTDEQPLVSDSAIRELGLPSPPSPEQIRIHDFNGIDRTLKKADDMFNQANSPCLSFPASLSPAMSRSARNTGTG
ncbi:hypothetical protein FJ492_25515 [Mesorhizobium sp. B2-5-4]|uniref:hypothetical protein n=1 Tax=Mesorhizobium sp. B2-5-4 TaxID=2589926 RepID=UPI001126EE32|nr:hypothetical protein [Mesorhizobium sp. B2-5-4]TPK35965.1 hypothetical protein FJ492_25515 [Mesorhizobium sp. B2-5-4]